MIKVLFATETFAVGVNAPTKTVIFTSIKKQTKKKLRCLFTEEYKQMAGRAGRRGLDTKGTVILLFLYGISSKLSVKNMMLGGVPALKSKFYLNYSFILKMSQSNIYNINDFLGKTLYSIENKKFISNFEEELINIKKKCDDTKPLFSVELLNSLNNYYKLDKKESTFNGIKIKISNKELKKNNRMKEQIKKNISDFASKYNSYLKYIDLKNKLDYMEEDLVYYSGYTNNKINNYIFMLKKFEYIKDNNKDYNLLCLDDTLPKGILAGQSK